MFVSVPSQSFRVAGRAWTIDENKVASDKSSVVILAQVCGPIFLLFAVLKTTLDCNFVHMYKNIKLLLMINLRLELIFINSVINLDAW